MSVVCNWHNPLIYQCNFAPELKAFQVTILHWNQLLEQAFELKNIKSGPLKIVDILPGEIIAMRSIDQIWLSDMDFSSGQKINFHDPLLEDGFGLGLPQYQDIKKSADYRLLTPVSSKRSNSTFGGHPESCQISAVDINKSDAKKLGIKSGQNIKLFNPKGEVILNANVGQVVPPGVLCSLKGAWLETSPTNQTVNALIDSSSRTDIGDGADFNDTYADIEII